MSTVRFGLAQTTASAADTSRQASPAIRNVPVQPEIVVGAIATSPISTATTVPAEARTRNPRASSEAVTARSSVRHRSTKSPMISPAGVFVGATNGNSAVSALPANDASRFAITSCSENHVPVSVVTNSSYIDDDNRSPIATARYRTGNGQREPTTRTGPHLA